MADGTDHEMSPTLRAALEHRARCHGIKSGRMFAWHGWRLSIDPCGCMSSAERLAQTREFTSIVRDVLDALTTLGFVDGSEHPLAGLDKVQFEQRTCGHWREGGLSITNPGWDDVDALKMPITEGALKAAYKHDGTLFVGTAHYGLNNMWRLVHGEAIAYVASHECFDLRPGLPEYHRVSSSQRVREVAALTGDASSLQAFRQTLHGRELEIFRDRVIADKPATLKALGDRWNVSPERVRQMEKRILVLLRNHKILEST